MSYEKREAVEAAGVTVATGVVGAGTGAVLASGSLKGGVGTASLRLPGGVVVGAVVAANAAGSPCGPDGALYARGFVDDDRLRPRVPDDRDPGVRPASPPSSNTTLAVVATNARLDIATARRTASSGHDGLARALRPVHTLVDGDTVFALATGEVDAEAASPSTWPGAADVGGLLAVQAAAADAVMLAVLDAVLASTRVRTPALDVPGYLEAWPSGRPVGY